MVQMMPDQDGSSIENTRGILDFDKEYRSIPIGKSMTIAMKEFNKSVFSQIKDLIILSSTNKLLPREYYDYLLFNDKKYDLRSKKEFVGIPGNRKIGVECNTESSFSDKLSLYGILGGFGYPIPETLALIHKNRKIPKLNTIDSIAKLKRYLQNTNDYPIFTKPNFSSLSLGVANIDYFDKAKGKLVSGKNKYDIDQYLSEVKNYYEEGYLIQKMLVAHPITHKFSGANIATVRMLTMKTEKGPKLHRAAWKIPSSINVADNFWRSGNVIGQIDVKSGRVSRLVQGLGIEQKIINPKQISGQAGGELKVPNWNRIVDLALSAVDAFPALNLIGWDIAVCKDDPVIVEANDVPDLRLHQIAEGKGIRDQEMIDFVAYCKAKQKKHEKKIKEILKRTKKMEMGLALRQSTLKYK